MTSESIGQHYHITPQSMIKRREYIGLTQADCDVLKVLKPWAYSIAADVAREFYDKQFAFEPTARILYEHAARMRVEKPALRAMLEKAQAQYFREIFDESENGEFSVEYFEKRVKVGQVHNRYNLPLKWYLGGYMAYYDICAKKLHAKFVASPWSVAPAERALQAVFNLDMQAIVDGFMMDLLESAHMRIDVVSPEETKDLTEYVGQIRSAHQQEITEIVTQLGEGNLNIEVSPINEQDTLRNVFKNNIEQLREIVSKLQESSRMLYKAVDSATLANSSILQNVGRVSNGSQAQQDLADKAMREILDKVAGVSETMRALDASSREVSSVTEAISALALQTNMLALNASIEASRAGSAGSGFAVVAGEVRRLAERSTESSRKIAGIVQTMQSSVTHVITVVDTGGDYKLQSAGKKTLVEAVHSLQEKFSDMRAIADENLHSVNMLVEGAELNQSTTQRLKQLAGDIEKLSERFQL